MKIIILSGFLGAGKTTVLLQLARFLVGDDPVNNQVVILENEIGQVGVDDLLLKGSGYQVSELFAGCACCTSSGELRATVREITYDMKPKWLIVEATGLAYPNSIRETLLPMTDTLPVICTLVDAKRYLRMLRPAGELIAGQLECADTVLINKVDLVTEDVLSQVEQSVREHCPQGLVKRICGLEPIDTAPWQYMEDLAQRRILP